MGSFVLLFITPLIDILLKKRRDSQVRDRNVSSISSSISFVISLFISCTHQFTFLPLISSSSICSSSHLFLTKITFQKRFFVLDDIFHPVCREKVKSKTKTHFCHVIQIFGPRQYGDAISMNISLSYRKH